MYPLFHFVSKQMEEDEVKGHTQGHTIKKIRTRIQISRYLAHCSFLCISGWFSNCSLH